MAGLQEGEKKQVMFLKVSAGSWHNDSSIQVPLVKASHRANLTSPRQGRSLCPQWNALQRPMAKSMNVQFLIQGVRNIVETVTAWIIETYAGVLERAVNK